MISTAERILSAWQHKKQRDGSYRGNCPFKSDSNSQSFVLTIHDGEHGTWKYHAASGVQESGSLYELADLLRIPRPENGRVQVENTKQAYTDLADYALRHHAPREVFDKAGWMLTTIHNRPALRFPVATGHRARFIDDKGGYVWLEGEKTNCWYGLERALKMAFEKALPLVLCNGEASTIVAQHYGVPAFCGTGGEGAISETMQAELQTRWNGKLWLALDCDPKGQEAAKKLSEQFPEAFVIDLGLSDKGDLADFVGLHKDLSVNALKRLVATDLQSTRDEATNYIEFVSSNELLSQFNAFATESPELFGRVIEMPFASLRAAGGFANLITTKKLWLIGNISGGGKTVMSESLCDRWNELGYNVFYIGDEWTGMELTARRVQRADKSPNPVSYEGYLQYVNGKRELSNDESLSIAYAIRDIRSRSGQTYYMQTADSYRGVIFLEDILNAASDKISALKANGTRIDVIVLDYLSLYDTRGQANNLEEYKVGVFKSYCKSLDVLGVSTVQVNKEAEDRVTKRGGFLTQHDLYYVRADKGNLITTMNRVYKTNYEVHLEPDKPDAFKPYLDENGQPEATPHFAMVTVKNSVASPFEYCYFHFDFARLKICEGIAKGYHYDNFHRIPLPDTGAHMPAKVSLENL